MTENPDMICLKKKIPGYDSILRKLRYRVENIQRKSDTAVKRRLEAIDNPKAKRAATQQMRKDAYGCIRYAPELPEDCTIEEMTEIKSRMQISFRRKTLCDVQDLVQQTYYLQRQEILDGKAAQPLLDEWPLLFTVQGIYTHFELLTGVSMFATLQSPTFVNQVDKIHGFFEEKGKPPVRMLLQKRLIPSEAIHGKGGKIAATMALLAAHFGENFDNLVVEKDVSFH